MTAELSPLTTNQRWVAHISVRDDMLTKIWAGLPVSGVTATKFSATSWCARVCVPWNLSLANHFPCHPFSAGLLYVSQENTMSRQRMPARRFVRRLDHVDVWSSVPVASVSYVLLPVYCNCRQWSSRTKLRICVRVFPRMCDSCWPFCMVLSLDVFTESEFYKLSCTSSFFCDFDSNKVATVNGIEDQQLWCRFWALWPALTRRSTYAKLYIAAFRLQSVDWDESVEENVCHWNYVRNTCMCVIYKCENVWINWSTTFPTTSDDFVVFGWCVALAKKSSAIEDIFAFSERCGRRQPRCHLLVGEGKRHVISWCNQTAVSA